MMRKTQQLYLETDKVCTLPVDATVVVVLLQLTEDHGEGKSHGASRVHLVDLTSLAQRGLDDVPIVIIVLGKEKKEAVSERVG